MKVLQIVNSYGSAGGIETYVYDLSLALERAGHTTAIAYHAPGRDLYRFKGRAEYAIPGLSGSRIWRNPSVRLRLIEVLENEKPDMAYVHTFMEPEAGLELIRRLPTVFGAHTNDLCCPAGSKLLQKSDRICPYPAGVNCVAQAYLEHCLSRRPLTLMLQLVRQRRARRWAQKTGRIIVASKDMKRRLVADGFEADRVTLIPYPVRCPDSLAVPHQVSSPPIVLFAGRVTPQKGLIYLLRAMTVGRLPYRLLVAGDGYALPELKATAKRLKIESRVEFLGWTYGLDALYDACSVVVVPSVWPEPFGLVGPEAMGHAKPVVAFNVGGISDWLEDGVNGFLVPPKDVEGLAEKISLLLNDPNLARQMGEAGRQRVLNQYGIERHLERLLEVFREVIGEFDGEAGERL